MSDDVKNPESYIFPTTYAQKQIWFLNQLVEDSSAYSIPLAYEISGKLDVNALIRAIKEIVRRHETFRTTFVSSEQGPLQLVKSEIFIDIPLLEIKNEEAIIHYIDQETIRPFSLLNGPLIRASIIQQDERKYYFFLNIHHIILDHISLVKFEGELEILYRNYSGQTVSSLTEPEFHYADYAVWQKEWQTPIKLESKLDFWKKNLAGKSEYLNLPHDKFRPVEQSMKGGEIRFSLTLGLSEKIRGLARQSGVSVFIVLMTAYNILLSRYARQDELAVGVPFANRGLQPELDDIMGCFISTVPVYTKISNDVIFSDLLAQVRKNVFAVNAHQEVPFEMIVEAIRPKRNPSINPLFQVGFSFQDAPLDIHLHQLTSRSLNLHNQSAKFDLYTWTWEQEGIIQGLIEYNSDIYLQDTVTRLSHHFSSLLHAIVDKPESQVSALSMLSEKEILCVTKEWNQTVQHYPNQNLLHTMFEYQVTIHLDKVAAFCEGESITFRELDNQSNQLANYLVGMSLAPESPVAIAMDRSIDMLIACLSVLKAGACFLSLDPDFPKSRIVFMLQDSKAHLLLSTDSIINTLDLKDSISTLCLDNQKEKIQQQVIDRPKIAINGNDLAYVIYTSGSTGQPKGVMIQHKSAANFLCSMSNCPGLNSDDRLLAITTTSFDISILELFLPLSVGASVTIAIKEDVEDDEAIIDLLEEYDINVMQATPSMWQMLLASGWEGQKNLKVLCGGEALTVDLAYRLVPIVNQLWNMYGPTETTVWSSCFQIETTDSPILIGSPIANTQFYVLDPHMQPVPVGVFGELYISGYGVAKGYLGQDDLTAERFLENPFDVSGSKIYKTGDLVRYRAKGMLEYAQRLDNQVKIRGFRIELGEIEFQLNRIQGIEKAIVLVRTLRQGDARLVAYIVMDAECNMTATELRKTLRQNLPEYMLPQHFVEIDKIPKTPNGKVDKYALLNRLGNSAESADEVTPPRSYAERELAKIWADLLEVDIRTISIYDNFFDIGGHSLLSMQVILKVKKSSGVKLNPRTIILNSLEIMALSCGFVEDK